MPVLGLGLLLGAVELAGVAAVVAVQGERASGWPAAALSAGSLLGGVVYGRRRWPGRTSVQAVVLTVVAGVLVAVAAGAVAAAPGTVVPLLLVLAVTGVAVAPGIVVAYLLADERAPVAGAESTAWVNAAFNLGVAAGGLLAGVLVDAAGVAVALVVGAAVAVVVAVPGVGRSLSVRWGSRR
jgi:predicted MFS family arabinose efflux permease